AGFPVLPAPGIQVRTMETLRYNGSGALDTVTVTGSDQADDITIASVPTNAAAGTNAASSALVFFGTEAAGSGWEGPPGGFFTPLPGVAGGAFGPDLLLNGLASLRANGGPGTTDNELYIDYPSEAAVTDPNTTIDPFGFGVGVIIPGFGAGNAYDTINATDSQVTASSNSAGPLLTVNIDTATFNPSPNPGEAGLFVNAGFEAVPAPGPFPRTADDITVTLSANFNIEVNGGDPVPAFAPEGDALTIQGTSGALNVFSDDACPPN